MANVKKKETKKVSDPYVLSLHPANNIEEIAVGEHYYDMYPLPADAYTKMMSTMRGIYSKLSGAKDAQHTAAIEAARALAQNIGQIDDEDLFADVKRLLEELSDSRRVHPLEFISHPDFSAEIADLMDILLDGVEEEDKANLSLPQKIRVFEVCLMQNFIPVLRLATDANKIFRVVQ